MKGLPKTVYKFRPWDLDSEEKRHLNAKRILQDQTVYFAKPQQFNDPFDLDLVPDYSLLSPQEWIKKFHYLKRYAQRNGWTEKELEDIIENVLIGVLPIWYNPFQVEEFGFRMSREYRKVAGIFSASKSFSNILLWSHYAENHNGICIGFDLTKLSDSTDSSFSVIKYPISFKKPRVKPEIDEEIKDLLLIYSAKSSFWSYEKEVRLFKLIHNEDDRAVMFDPSAITEVIFGCQMHMHMKRRTYEFLKDQISNDNIKFFSAHKVNNYYLLRLKQFDPKANY